MQRKSARIYVLASFAHETNLDIHLEIYNTIQTMQKLRNN